MIVISKGKNADILAGRALRLLAYLTEVYMVSLREGKRISLFSMFSESKNEVVFLPKNRRKGGICSKQGKTDIIPLKLSSNELKFWHFNSFFFFFKHRILSGWNQTRLLRVRSEFFFPESLTAV